MQLCCLAQKDSFTPKVLKLHFVSVKHGSALIWYVAHSTFDIEAESCLTVTNCDFRTFRVKESFWAKQQSCITLKVSLRKWCQIFVFVCFNGCHFTLSGFTKEDIFFEQSSKWKVVFLTKKHHISKNWEGIFDFH